MSTELISPNAVIHTLARKSFFHGADDWKDISGYEGFYQVSKYGQIRSLDRVVKHKNGQVSTRKGKVLRYYFYKKQSYAIVNLFKEGKRKTHSVRNLVLTTYVGTCPKHMMIVQDIKDKNNNRLDNLLFKPRAQKLTRDKVLDIRNKYLKGDTTYKTLGENYGVRQNTIRDIIQKNIWKHV